MSSQKLCRKTRMNMKTPLKQDKIILVSTVYLFEHILFSQIHWLFYIFTWPQHSHIHYLIKNIVSKPLNKIQFMFYSQCKVSIPRRFCLQRHTHIISCVICIVDVHILNNEWNLPNNAKVPYELHILVSWIQCASMCFHTFSPMFIFRVGC